VEHSLCDAYKDRRLKKRDYRRLWIVRINAAARQHGMSYSKLMQGLQRSGVELNRKVLADLAYSDEQAFSRLAEMAKAKVQ
ncbi:MAG: 50S ribosomal protein L20, partial [Desulfohalobiaceae bacterium]